mmetsp:Transcript_5/g.5  ORF Transcript_5/g.5 Transcript_5/m.5 type:complete len:954 (+) Transcript_5:81-2942(+)
MVPYYRHVHEPPPPPEKSRSPQAALAMMQPPQATTAVASPNTRQARIGIQRDSLRVHPLASEYVNEIEELLERICNQEFKHVGYTQGMNEVAAVLVVRHNLHPPPNARSGLHDPSPSPLGDFRILLQNCGGFWRPGFPLLEETWPVAQRLFERHSKLAEHWRRLQVQVRDVAVSALLSFFTCWFGPPLVSRFVVDFIIRGGGGPSTSQRSQNVDDQHSHTPYSRMLTFLLATIDTLTSHGLLDRDYETTMKWFSREMQNVLMPFDEATNRQTADINPAARSFVDQVLRLCETKWAGIVGANADVRRINATMAAVGNGSSLGGIIHQSGGGASWEPGREISPAPSVVNQAINPVNRSGITAAVAEQQVASLSEQNLASFNMQMAGGNAPASGSYSAAPQGASGGAVGFYNVADNNPVDIMGQQKYSPQKLNTAYAPPTRGPSGIAKVSGPPTAGESESAKAYLIRPSKARPAEDKSFIDGLYGDRSSQQEQLLQTPASVSGSFASPMVGSAGAGQQGQGSFAASSSQQQGGARMKTIQNLRDSGYDQSYGGDLQHTRDRERATELYPQSTPQQQAQQLSAAPSYDQYLHGGASRGRDRPAVDHSVSFEQQHDNVLETQTNKSYHSATQQVLGGAGGAAGTPGSNALQMGQLERQLEAETVKHSRVVNENAQLSKKYNNLKEEKEVVDTKLSYVEAEQESLKKELQQSTKAVMEAEQNQLRLKSETVVLKERINSLEQQLKDVSGVTTSDFHEEDETVNMVSEHLTGYEQLMRRQFSSLLESDTYPDAMRQWLHKGRGTGVTRWHRHLLRVTEQRLLQFFELTDSLIEEKKHFEKKMQAAFSQVKKLREEINAAAAARGQQGGPGDTFTNRSVSPGDSALHEESGLVMELRERISELETELLTQRNADQHTATVEMANEQLSKELMVHKKYPGAAAAAAAPPQIAVVPVHMGARR